MVDGPFDEALFRGQVENIEAVDPRREDYQRSFIHLFGRRAVLHELIQRRLVHDLTRRGGQIHTKLECFGVCMRQLTLFQVVDQMAHTFHKVLPLGFDCAFEDDRVG